jgi:protein-L-isoaspartate O-methyltransferase
VNWEPRAEQLAAAVTHPASRWRHAIATIPRHTFTPRWWTWAAPGPGLWHDTWALRDGPVDPAAWLDAAYANRSLITQVGTLHADHATQDSQPTGLPASSATMPGLLVQMYRHAMITDTTEILDIGTGSGYGTALLCTRLTDSRVSTIDVDGYLTMAAAERLSVIGMHPQILTCDATGPLPGTYNRIVSTVAARPLPPSWLTALRPGGRLVTTIAGTALILTADKTPDGGAHGRIEWDRAGFMHTRTGPGYPTAPLEQFTAIRDAEGDRVTTGHLPVVNVAEAWELYSMLGIMAPGIQHHYEETPDGTRTAWMIHPDQSWARATAAPGQAPVIHQAGPRDLWALLDQIRRDWLSNGSLPAYGATAAITPDGTITLTRGRWTARIPPEN